jgi:hypothetical protein
MTDGEARIVRVVPSGPVMVQGRLIPRIPWRAKLAPSERGSSGALAGNPLRERRR